MLIPQKREGSGVGFRLGLVLESGGGAGPGGFSPRTIQKL